jgi:hypothetical protein
VAAVVTIKSDEKDDKTNKYVPLLYTVSDALMDVMVSLLRG